jgi:hypothetical protein
MIFKKGVDYEKKFIKYGKSPFKVAVIHGGPGAPGSMASVAKELSSQFAILGTYLRILGYSIAEMN